MRGRSKGTAAAALLVLALALTAVPVGAGASGAAAGPELRPDSAVNPGNLTASGSVSSTVAGPAGSYSPGDRIGFRYAVAVTPYPAGTANVTVWFPPSQATFESTTGTLAVTIGGRNLSLTGPGFSMSSAGFSMSNTSGVVRLFDNNTTLKAGAPATFSTQQQTAIMTSVPYGGLRLEVEWQWEVLRSDGLLLNSSWSPSPPVSLAPAQYALLSSVPANALPGTTLTTCLTGPIAGRNFAAYLVSGSRGASIAQASGTAPAGTLAPYCLALDVPLGTANGTASLRIWELVSGGPDFLLYSEKVHVGNLGPTPAAPFPYALWGSWAAAVVGIATVVVALAVFLRRRRDGSARTGAP